MKSSKFNSALYGFTLISASLLLAGCAETSAPVAPISTAPVTTNPVLKPEVKAQTFKLDADATHNAYLPSDDLQPLPQDEIEQLQRQLLLEAQNALSSQPERALAIAETLKDSAYPNIRQQNLLLLLKAYLANQQFNALDQWLSTVRLPTVPEADRSEFVLKAVPFFNKTQNKLAAIELLLELDILTGNNNPTLGAREQLWDLLVQLSDNEIKDMQVFQHPRSKAWAQLLGIAQTFAGDSQAMQQAITDWQLRNPMMPALERMPAAVQQLSQTPAYHPAKVGVLLPLTGPFKSLGAAVQLGLVAATKEAQRQLIFIDSNESAEQIMQQLEQVGAEFVIGPLLRDHVDKLQQHANWRWPTLFLNSKAEGSVRKPDQFFFALGVEDEAAQMVQFFQQRKMQHPVLIYAVNPIGQRMAQAFQSMWQQQQGVPVESYSYGSQEQLQQVINTFLETGASETRVKELERLYGQSIKAEMHSRQDIDAIFLIADPVQTRLFKPFIDVTVSPTARSLPIFTSSRSHSLKVDRTEQRDLAGLTMTEMPWLLPGSGNQATLRQQYDQLFPEQEETLQRLFAMGYDAAQLIERLKQQQQFPNMTYHGLTGSLRLADGQSIQRQLTMAQYRQGRLRLVETNNRSR